MKPFGLTLMDGRCCGCSACAAAAGAGGCAWLAHVSEEFSLPVLSLPLVLLIGEAGEAGAACVEGGRSAALGLGG